MKKIAYSFIEHQDALEKECKNIWNLFSVWKEKAYNVVRQS